MASPVIVIVVGNPAVTMNDVVARAVLTLRDHVDVHLVRTQRPDLVAKAAMVAAGAAPPRDSMDLKVIVLGQQKAHLPPPVLDAFAAIAPHVEVHAAYTPQPAVVMHGCSEAPPL